MHYDEYLQVAQFEGCAYRVPTDSPESDGTLEWQATTLVVAELSAGGKAGLAYTYANRAAAILINELLASVINGP